MSAGQFIQPGSAYYFKGWNSNGGSPVPTLSTNGSKLPQKDSWKSWTNLSQFDDERSSSRGSGSIRDDVIMACKVGETREMQKEKAQQVAFACAGGRQNKAALMFQKRFERSEKFALVKEAEVRPPTPEIVPVKSEELGADEDTIPPPSDTPTVLQPPPLLDTKYMNSSPLPSTKWYSPKPWEFTCESPPPPPEEKDFNRKAKGFTGSYVTPYGTYMLEDGTYETCDL